MSARALGLGLVAAMTIVGAGLLLATEHLVMPWAVAGRSMEPTLREGDRVLVDRWTYRHRGPRVGEIVLVLGPRELPMVKRVAARRDPGRRLWVVGDNAAVSVDSRRFGALPAERLRGRVVFRYWPPSRVGPCP